MTSSTSLVPTPAALTLHVDMPGGYVKVIGEVICHAVPTSLKRAYPYMAGGDFWLLHRLWVAARYRQQGLGARLLDDILTLTEKRGISLVLRVKPFEHKGCPKTKLVRFYQQHGFKMLNTEKGLMQRL